MKMSLVNSFRSELDFLEKHLEEVKDVEVQGYIYKELKKLYSNLEDIVFIAYHNKGGKEND